MIIRSGLIRNREDVSKEAFDRHWLDVHGPLARAVPNLRAYTQNHVLTQLIAPSPSLHQIYGISQLWFDSVNAMNAVEQQLCVEDIKGFLSAVTIVIQQAGEWTYFGQAAPTQQKVMAVLAGSLVAGRSYADHLRAAFRESVAQGGRVRVNSVIEKGHSVDSHVARADDVVATIAELDVRGPLLNDIPDGLECLTALHVEQFPILRAPADATVQAWRAGR